MAAVAVAIELTIGRLRPVVRVTGAEEVSQENDERKAPQDLSVLGNVIFVILYLVHVVQSLSCVRVTYAYIVTVRCIS